MIEPPDSDSISQETRGIQFQTELLPNETALQALLRESQLPEATLAEAASKGAVWAALKRGKGQTRPRRLRTLTESVSTGSLLMLNYDARILAAIPQAMQRVADHVNYSVWFKPSGMLCQGSKWSDHTVATSVAETLCDKSCYLVHRLDRAACGVMLIAHTKNALRALTKMFEQRAIEKTYCAIVSGRFTPATPLRIDEQLDGKSALTTVHEVTHNGTLDVSELSLTIESGRKHQIRRHLAQRGYPIVGDRLYGESQHTQNLQLVACQLSLICPFTTENVKVSIDAKNALNDEVAV